MIRVWHTGALTAGGTQDDGLRCLGGYRSASPARGLYVRRGRGLANIRVDFASSGNGSGIGSLMAAGDGSLQWGAPGGALGAPAAIAAGETKDIVGALGHQWIRVTRTTGDGLLGGESLTLMDQYNTVGGGANWDDAEASSGGAQHYAVVLENAGAESADVRLYVPGSVASWAVADVSQLPSSGGGTIESSSDLRHWATSGFVWIYGTATSDLGGVTYPATLLEVAYYTRVGNVLTVASAGRGQLGTSATEGVVNQIIMPGPGIRLATEALVGAGVQTIADAWTAPVGVTWLAQQWPGHATPVTLAAGAYVGLWLEQSYPAGAFAQARVRNEVRASWDDAGALYSGVRGLHAVANDALQREEIYIAAGAAPDLDGAPAATWTARPYSFDPGWSPSTKYFAVRAHRNRHNLVTYGAATIYETDADGAVMAARPSGPDVVQLRPWSGGRFRLDARYMPDRDGAALRGDTWLIYFRADGTALDPDDVTPVEISMGAVSGQNLAPVNLLWFSDAYLDQTPGEVLVRIRRSGAEVPAEDPEEPPTVLPDVDSDNTLTTTAVTTTVGPARRRVEGSYGRAAGVRHVPASPSVDPVVIDAEHSIYWQPLSDGMALYAGSDLVWCWMWRHPATGEGVLLIPNSWSVETYAGVSGSGTGAIEVLSWTGSDDRLGVNVNGARVIEIDVTQLAIRCGGLDALGVGASTPAETPVHARFADTCFQSWRAEDERWATYMAALSGGNVTVAGAVDVGGYTQGAIEALVGM